MASLRRPGRSAASNKPPHSDEADADDPLSELTRPQLLQINRAFDSVISPRPSHRTQIAIPSTSISNTSHQKSANHEQDEEEPGGFVVDDQASDRTGSGGGGFLISDEGQQAGGFMMDEDPQPGGFFPDHEPERIGDITHATSAVHPTTSTARDAIPLRGVPEALKILGLPYRDSEILDVFEQAVSSDEEDQQSQTRWVSRRQFSRVCAALMAGDGDGDGHADTDDDMGDPRMDDKSPPSDSDASFVAPAPQKQRRKPKRASRAIVSDDFPTDDGSFIASEESQSRKVSQSRPRASTRHSRKKAGKSIAPDDHESVLDTFQLFFPQPSVK